MPQFGAEEAVDIVLSQELLLMQMLYYHLTVHNPYRPVEGLLIDIKVGDTAASLICYIKMHFLGCTLKRTLTLLGMICD